MGAAALTVPAAPIINGRRLGRAYRSVWALRDIDLSVQAGEIVGIVGPDGAGKSTLLQICAGILDPSEGTCEVMGLDVVRESKAVASRIGYMSQGFTLYDRLTVDENLQFSADIRRVPEADYQLRRAELVAMAGLEEFGDWPAGKLSGGMRKKLSLCGNLIHQPKLLILDEPGLGVDPLSRSQLWVMLEDAVARGVTILVATSYMDEAQRCCRIMLLNAGRALAFDTTAAVRARASGRVFEVTSTDPPTTAAAIAARDGSFGIQTLPDRVRFLLTADEPAAAGQRLPPPATGPTRSAEPTLDDVFVQSAGVAEASASYVEALPTPLRRAGVEAENLTVRFGQFTAVSAVSLSALPGQATALLGPNGAGKTTLMRALCGLVSITAGTAHVAGYTVDLTSYEVRQHIGYMSQRFSLYVDLSVLENLRFFASAYGLRGRARNDAIASACAMTGIQANSARVSDLSAATQQRLALASSILHRPSALFLDEPTSGVDPLSRYRFWRLIRGLCRAGMTVIVSTHYLDEARYCDQLALMHRGRLVAHGTVGALRGRFGVAATATIDDLFAEAIAQASAATPEEART
jgi:ABC-2 type transport system ATP-binding protein